MVSFRQFVHTCTHAACRSRKRVRAAKQMKSTWQPLRVRRPRPARWPRGRQPLVGPAATRRRGNGHAGARRILFFLIVARTRTNVCSSSGGTFTHAHTHTHTCTRTRTRTRIRARSMFADIIPHPHLGCHADELFRGCAPATGRCTPCPLPVVPFNISAPFFGLRISLPPVAL